MNRSALYFIGASVLSGCGAATSPAVAPPTTACKTGVQALVEDHANFLVDPGSNLKKLHGHVPRAVQQANDGGKSDEAQVFPITVALDLNHSAELAQELSDLYQPGNSKFGKFLSPAEFRLKYGASADQIRQVEKYLQEQGLTGVAVDANGLLVHAQGTLAALNATFHTEVHQYTDASGKNFHAPAFEMQIPRGLPIQAVHGLENQSVWHHHATQASPNATSKNGTGPSGGLSPVDIRTAYQVPTNLDGSGQTVAVFELDGYSKADITAYETHFGLPAAPLQNVLIDGASGGSGAGAGEVTLDIELILAIAPRIAKVMVYEGNNDAQSILNTYARIANDNVAKAVSTSWGTSEESNTASFAQSENSIFMQMAAQGQTIYSAAGDAGAYDNGSTLSVDDPSTQPYIVAVGGTTLTLAANSSYGNETTWNSGSSSGGAGGGGISKIWSQPSWQKCVAGNSAKASTTMRNIPDVSLESDIASGYAIYFSGGWGVWGGTSCAAPLWAAFTALVNQQRAINGLGSVGYITPLIYQIGQSARYASDFHDIRDGSTNLFYPAVSGFDDATGWGSFNATNLLQDLSQVPTGALTTNSTLTGGVNSCSGG